MADIQDCLRQVMAIQGALGASLIDYPSGSMVGAAGRGADRSDGSTAAGAANLINATVDTAAFATIGAADSVEDIVITAGNGYHLVHLMPQPLGGRLALYVWVDRMLGNLAVAQHSVRRIGLQLAAA